LLLVVVSCGYFEEDAPEDYLARVGDDYLIEEDLGYFLGDLPIGVDSISARQKAIENWVTDQLLLGNAERNLPELQIEEIESLVSKYRHDLYGQAYLQEITMQQLDTVIDDAAIEEYYNTRQEQYVLNEDLVMFRYISIPMRYENSKQLSKKFRSEDEETYAYMDSLSLTFNSYFLNDSIWVRKSDLFERVVPISASNEAQFLKENVYSEVEDSLSKYFIYVKDILPRGEQAPLEYVKPVIRKILLNRRKLDFIAELKNDLYRDAIEQDKAEIR